MNIVIINMRRTSIHLAPVGNAPGVKLVPGQNDVPGDIWGQCRKHHVVKMYLDAGYLKESRAQKATPLAESPKSVSVENMAKHIDRVTEESAPILDDWGKKDDRPVVRKAIEAKKKELKKKKGK